MPRNFNLAMPRLGGAVSLSALKDLQVLVRIFLGLLLAANLVAAAFAFHLFDDSPDAVAKQVQSVRQQTLQQVVKLNHNRTVAAKVEKGREEGTKFISTYMTSRRATYSTIIGEIDQMAGVAGVKSKDWTLGLDAVKGSDTIDMMTISANFEGEYKNLLTFINQIDLSKRFLIIESLAASPQQNGSLQVTLHINTFVKEDGNNEPRGRS